MRSLLGPEGRLLNHAISSVGGSRIGPRSFIGRYVFPDGELIDVGQVVVAMEVAGFEVRDVESLREHYAQTLHCWVRNLERHWDAAVAEVGVRRARVWQLYMAGLGQRVRRRRDLGASGAGRRARARRAERHAGHPERVGLSDRRQPEGAAAVLA
jgi:cyclopropane fatty-acyl-phospholipid synthase-like methyltransferase